MQKERKNKLFHFAFLLFLFLLFLIWFTIIACCMLRCQFRFIFYTKNNNNVAVSGLGAPKKESNDAIESDACERWQRKRNVRCGDETTPLSANQAPSPRAHSLLRHVSPPQQHIQPSAMRLSCTSFALTFTLPWRRLHTHALPSMPTFSQQPQRAWTEHRFVPLHSMFDRMAAARIRLN